MHRQKRRWLKIRWFGIPVAPLAAVLLVAGTAVALWMATFTGEVNITSSAGIDAEIQAVLDIEGDCTVTQVSATAFAIDWLNINPDSARCRVGVRPALNAGSQAAVAQNFSFDDPSGALVGGGFNDTCGLSIPYLIDNPAGVILGYELSVADPALLVPSTDYSQVVELLLVDPSVYDAGLCN